MYRSVLYIVFGYLCGSILFARVSAALLRRGDITSCSADGNPGTANAFLYGGFWCGLLALCGDLSKGFFPVYMYLRGIAPEDWGAALVFVLIAPVIGHMHPIFYRFRGGKGIAVTFGVLLGLYPNMRPALVLAFVFILFSTIIRITPHYDRTVWTYRCAAVCMMLFLKSFYVKTAFFMIALAVNISMRLRDEKREKCQVRLLWMH